MNTKTISLFLLIPFLLLSVYAVYQDGYVGIFKYQLQSAAGWQVLADLVIACILILTWLIPNAYKNNRNPWPFIIITAFLGSIGPLLYLVMAKDKD